MSFQERQITQILIDYKIALAWVEALIPNIKTASRIYKYLEVIESSVRANKDGTTNTNPLLLTLEAHQKSDLLIEIHKKFYNRTEKSFVDKLHASLLGPVYLHKEILQGEGPSKNTHGRDVESEFYFATHVKNPDIVSFQGNDVVYDLKDYKMGVEVKRIHSLEQIESNFKIACNQIQKNPDVRYGMVGFRFDNHYLLEDQFGLKLIDRGENILSYASHEECFRYAEVQTKYFVKKVGSILLSASHSFPKVMGIGVFGLFPGRLKISEIPFLAGNFSFAWFGGVPRPCKKVFTKMTNEFEKPQGIESVEN